MTNETLQLQPIWSFFFLQGDGLGMMLDFFTIYIIIQHVDAPFGTALIPLLVVTAIINEEHNR